MLSCWSQKEKQIMKYVHVVCLNLNICLKVVLNLFIYLFITQRYQNMHNPTWFLLRSRLFIKTRMWKAAQDFKQHSCALVMEGRQEKPFSGQPPFSRFCSLTAKWEAGGPFHYWFIFNGSGSWDGASYMATFTVKWLCSVWILMWLHVNRCIKYSGLRKHLGLLAGCWS